MGYVVRPPGILGTPKAVAAKLACKVKKYPNPKITRVFNYNTNFFMTNVAPNHVQGAPDGYAEAFTFFQANKLGQRQRLIAAGIPCPETFANPSGTLDAGQRVVVRPLRHSGGRHYRVADSLDFTAGAEYASLLYPKKREYRVIFVFGKPLIYLRKKPNEDVTDDAPWGHINSHFQTINDVANCRLSATDCVVRLADFAPVKAAHIVAADILYNSKHDKPYVVLELNLCPALTIEDNLAKVVEAINAR